jgi:hypothetical protein
MADRWCCIVSGTDFFERKRVLAVCDAAHPNSEQWCWGQCDLHWHANIGDWHANIGDWHANIRDGCSNSHATRQPSTDQHATTTSNGNRSATLWTVPAGRRR